MAASARTVFSRPGIWFTVILIVAGVIFSLARTIGKDDSFQDDFGAYYKAGTLAGRGESPYVIEPGPAPFVYSPAIAYLFVPLQPFGYIGAVRVWTMVNWGLCLACIVMAARLIRAEEQDSVPLGVIWLAAIPILSYSWNNVRSGQAGALLFACCLAWAVCRRSGWRFVGGLFLSVAVALKVFPILILPYLALRRDWRGLFGSILGGTALILLPVFWVGPEGVVSLHRQWIAQTVNTQSVNQTIRVTNQSALGMLSRLPHVSNGEDCFSIENLQSIVGVYPIVALVIAGLFYAVLGWSLRLPAAGAESVRENLHLCLLFILVTLINPRAWTYNFVALLLPSMVLAQIAWQKRPGWEMAIAALLGLTLTSVVPPPPNYANEWRLEVWLYQSRHFWAAMGLALACTWCYSVTRNPSFWGKIVQRAILRMRRPVESEVEKVAAGVESENA